MIHKFQGSEHCPFFIQQYSSYEHEHESLAWNLFNTFRCKVLKRCTLHVVLQDLEEGEKSRGEITYWSDWIWGGWPTHLHFAGQRPLHSLQMCRNVLWEICIVTQWTLNCCVDFMHRLESNLRVTNSNLW